MTLRFKDKRGRWGKVTESLEVEYSGPWEEEVSTVVEEAREEEPDNALYDPEDPLAYVLIELPEKAPIREVGREDQVE